MSRPWPATEAEARPAGTAAVVYYNQAHVELVYPVKAGDLYAVVHYPELPQYPWSVQVGHLDYDA